jgi:hypothetical protein
MKPDLKLRPAIAPYRASACLGLALAALLAACAGNPKNSHEATEAAYHRDAQACQARNLIQPKPRSNVAGNLSEEISAGVNTPGYLKCMDQLGYRQDPKTDPLLKALDRCRKQAARPASASAKAGGVELSSDIDQAAFQACMKQRGFGSVISEPLETGPAK